MSQNEKTDCRPAPKTILVIDDEEMVLTVTQKMLEAFGYEILLARCGEEAIQVAESYKGEIPVALLDMSMPGMDGPQTFPILKKIRPDIKVIVCSGCKAGTEDMLSEGAFAHLSKPFRMVDLMESVKQALAV